MQSPNFNFKLDIRSEEIESGNFQYDTPSSSNGGEEEEEMEAEAE